MRALASFARIGLLAGLASSAVMSGGAGQPRFVAGRKARPETSGEGPRVSIETARGREIGERKDPYFGIKSRGRRGAWARMLAMEAARATKPVGSRFHRRNLKGAK